MEAMRAGLQRTGQRSELVPGLVAGALAGLVATAPMTAAMELMHRRLPWWQRYPLPPTQVVNRVTSALGLRKHMRQEHHLATTLIAHFGYGAAAGAVYGPLAQRVPLPAALKGTMFGVLVWGASYLGLLPALGIMEPATEHPARRNALMIAAHMLWGAILAVVTDLVES